MTAHKRRKKIARKALRHPSVPRIPAGHDPRNLVMMMRPLRVCDIARLPPAYRAQFDAIRRSRTWHGGPVELFKHIFGIFIGGRLTGTVEVQAPVPGRKVPRISYWLSAACRKLASQVLEQFMVWAFKSEGLRVFELKWPRDADVADAVVECIRLPAPLGVGEFRYSVQRWLASA